MNKKAPRAYSLWFLCATFLVALAGLIYQLIGATLASYMLGDTVQQFSFVIGLFLFAMGIGTWVSRYFEDVVTGFISIQLGLALCGGLLSPAVFLFYGYIGDVYVFVYAAIFAIGVLVGAEIPLIARLLKMAGEGRFQYETVLSVDYIGALAASVIFPLFLLPFFGLMSGGILMGFVNLAVAVVSIFALQQQSRRGLVGFAVLVGVILGSAFWASERIVNVSEAQIFDEDIIYSEQSPYQKITITRWGESTKLFLNNSIQFDTRDEFRYHETLVHPAMLTSQNRQNVLVLGGGDGMAVREVLKHEDVEKVTLVDLDAKVTDLFMTHDDLAQLNNFSLQDQRVKIVNQDAWKFVQNASELYNVIIIDLPDPKDVAVSKLYTKQFYQMVLQTLAKDGAISSQSSSPLFSRSAYWSAIKTWQAAASSKGDIRVTPYHAYVPSFGEWGFALVTRLKPADNFAFGSLDLRYLTAQNWSQMQYFSPDIEPLEVEVNRLQNHVIVQYYNQGWEHWFQ